MQMQERNRTNLKFTHYIKCKLCWKREGSNLRWHIKLKMKKKKLMAHKCYFEVEICFCFSLWQPGIFPCYELSTIIVHLQGSGIMWKAYNFPVFLLSQSSTLILQEVSLSLKFYSLTTIVISWQIIWLLMFWSKMEKKYLICVKDTS